MRIRILVVLAAAPVCVTAWLLACGPEWPTLETVTASYPANREQFDNGNLGVVRPRFNTQDLARAYRVLSGRPPLRVGASSPSPDRTPREIWESARFATIGDRVPQPGRSPRVNEFYQTAFNCLDDAYTTATSTQQARITRFGATSREVRDWTLAQDAVFANCDEEPMVLPSPAPADADPFLVADRAYQTAAAYFYAGQYDESERRFRAIATDRSSPWRPLGMFLAARSKIRKVTANTDASAPLTEGLSSAERLLDQVLEDREAGAVHDSARRLINFIAARVRPVDQLQRLSQRLSTSSEAIDDNVLKDFSWLLGRVGDAPINDDLVTWVLAMHVGDGDALTKAISKWETTHSTAWLAAVLWHIPASHPATAAVLEAAASVGRESPAFASVAFPRVRLLIRLGKLDEARKILAALPEKPAPGFDLETVNLLDGERLMLAQNLTQFIAAAPRTVVTSETAPPAFDEDAAVALSQRFPLTRLPAVAESTQLPGRLRTRVAIAAFTRAIVLGREDIALRVAPTLRALVPALRTDLDKYISALNAVDRQRAAILLILRTPGMRLRIRGLDDDGSLDPEPARSFGDFGERWWCGDFPDSTPIPAGTANSELIDLLYENHRVPYPVFITAAERTAVEKELASLKQTGHAARFLARTVIEWAKAKPTDPDAAEALSRIVKGWPRVCRDPADAGLSRQAFQLLHTQFPTSTWAAQTKYWYK